MYLSGRVRFYLTIRCNEREAIGEALLETCLVAHQAPDTIA